MYADYQYYTDTYNADITTPLTEEQFKIGQRVAALAIEQRVNSLVDDPSIVTIMERKLKDCECALTELAYKWIAEDGKRSGTKKSESVDGWSVSYETESNIIIQRETEKLSVMRTYLTRPVNILYGGR